jgi:hypothetical protein
VQRCAGQQANLAAADIGPDVGGTQDSGGVHRVAQALQRYQKRIAVLLQAGLVGDGLFVGEEDVAQQHRPHHHEGQHHRRHTAAHQRGLGQPPPQSAQRAGG